MCCKTKKKGWGEGLGVVYSRFGKGKHGKKKSKDSKKAVCEVKMT